MARHGRECVLSLEPERGSRCGRIRADRGGPGVGLGLWSPGALSIHRVKGCRGRRRSTRWPRHPLRQRPGQLSL